jgi:prepilin signal peptidase PulO-like enzyme (type II secretory pathway)
LFCLAFLRFGVSWHAAVMCLFYAALITIFLADLSSHIIPDSLNVFVALLSAIAFLARWEGSPLDHVIGLFAVSLPLWAVAAVTKGFGGGDIKLFAVLGLMLGWKLVVLTAVLSFVIGGIAGIILLMTRRAASGTKIAFGPFICVSAVIASVWGDNIIGWYLGLP